MNQREDVALFTCALSCHLEIYVRSNGTQFLDLPDYRIRLFFGEGRNTYVGSTILAQAPISGLFGLGLNCSNEIYINGINLLPMRRDR